MITNFKNLEEENKENPRVKSNLDLLRNEDIPFMNIDIPEQNFSSEDIKRTLLFLRSNADYDVIRTYTILVQMIKHQYDMPLAEIRTCLNHTLSTDPTIAQQSQEFLTFLFDLHQLKTAVFDPQSIDFLGYITNLLEAPFISSTHNYLISIFRADERFWKVLEVNVDLINLIFSAQPTCEIGSCDKYGRLKFVELLMRLEFININEFLYFKVKCVLLELITPNMQNFDPDLVTLILSLTSRCINNSNDELWLTDFFNRNCLSILLSFYSDSNTEANLYISHILCGLSASAQHFSNQLLCFPIVQFFSAHFKTSGNFYVQQAFLKTLRNLLLSIPVENVHLLADEIMRSQIFNDVCDMFSTANFPMKKSAIKLFCFLIRVMKQDFIPIMENYEVIQKFIDVIYSDSESTKAKVVNALSYYGALYEKTNDEAIQELFSKIDLVESIDDYIDEHEGSVDALNLRTILYQINDFV